MGLDPEAADRMRASRAVIERLVADGATVYGVTTGFGDLANVRIEPEQVAELQRNLVRSHTAGVGEPLSAKTLARDGARLAAAIALVVYARLLAP